MTARTTRFNPPSRLAACTCRMGGSSRLAAGSFVARAASGMAAVGRRPPGHIAAGSGFFASHGQRDRGRPRRADAMGVLQHCGRGSETRGEGCICGPRPGCGGARIRATRSTSTRAARHWYRDSGPFFPGRPAVRGFILVGINGVPQQDPFGDMTTMKFSPNIGIILAAAGCGAAFIAAIMSFHHRQNRRQFTHHRQKEQQRPREGS